MDWLTFVISLAPVPGVAEASAIANKITNDRALSARLDNIVTAIGNLDTRIQQMESGIERVEAIGAIAKDHPSVHALLADLFDEVKAKTSEFTVETSDWSSQQILRTLIDADWVSISATNRSQNLIDATHVKSQKTSFVAKGGSQNVIRDSSFSGDQGSVGMTGVHTQRGHVSFAGPSVTYQGRNSQTEMGGWYMGTDASGNFVLGVKSDPEVVATCPNCGGESWFRQSQVQTSLYLTCSICGRTGRVR